jgi:hypothetical protein
MLEGLVASDGSPAKKMYYLARMDGHLDHRDELEGRLLQLGHRETAEALPAEVPARGGPWRRPCRRSA